MNRQPQRPSRFSQPSKRGAQRGAHSAKSTFPTRRTLSTGNTRPLRANRHKVRRTASNNNELKQMHLSTVESQHWAKAKHKPRSLHHRAIFTKRRLRTLGIIALVLALLAVVIFGLGTCVYRSSLTSAVSLDADTKNALSPADANAASYTLVAGLTDDSMVSQDDSLAASSTPRTSPQFAGALMLIRIDESQNQISFLGIPNTLTVSLSDGQEHLLREAVLVGSEAELVSAVSQSLDIPINHYVRTTDREFADLVDALGGVQVNVEQKVDDPRVGTIVLNAGEQTLNGNQALVFARAWNYQDGRAARLNNQKQLLTAILSQAQQRVESGDLTTLDALSQTFKTDLSYEDLERLAGVYASCQNLYYASLPTTLITQVDQSYYRISSEAWSSMKERFMAGEDPNAAPDTSQVDKAKTTIEVLNGSGADGYAAQAGQLLSQAGYDVTDTGNASSYVYNETLVVYKNEEDKLAAQAVVQDLGIGRTVFSGSFYSLTTNIQVYVGKDWKPNN